MCVCVQVCTYMYICYICVYLFMYIYVCEYVCVYRCIYVYLCMCMYVYVYIYIYMYVYMYMYVYVCMYLYACMYMYVYVCRYVYVCIYICVNVCMCVYIYMYIYMCACIYAWTHVDVCEGPYHPLRFGHKGCCFLRVRTPNLTGTLRHPTGWLIFNFLIALTGDIEFLSQCLLLWCTLHKWYSHAPQPCAPTVDHQPTIRTQI